MYLTDLTFIEEGNKDFLQGRPDMINFFKGRLVSATIRKILASQAGAVYKFQRESIISGFFSKLTTLTEQKAYELSLQIEARGKE